MTCSATSSIGTREEICEATVSSAFGDGGVEADDHAGGGGEVDQIARIDPGGLRELGRVAGSRPSALVASSLRIRASRRGAGRARRAARSRASGWRALMPMACRIQSVA